MGWCGLGQNKAICHTEELDHVGGCEEQHFQPERACGADRDAYKHVPQEDADSVDIHTGRVVLNRPKREVYGRRVTETDKREIAMLIFSLIVAVVVAAVVFGEHQ